MSVVILALSTLLGGTIIGSIGGYMFGSLKNKTRCKQQDCHSEKSNFCIDGLCPHHCKYYHDDKCRKLLE